MTKRYRENVNQDDGEAKQKTGENKNCSAARYRKLKLLLSWAYTNMIPAEPDRLFEEYIAVGLSFRQSPRNDDDGLHGFEVTDADGYVLFFGRPLQNFTQPASHYT